VVEGMIISLRGTNGSGKSTIVREIMKSYETIVKVKYPPDWSKRVPTGYICINKDSVRRLFVVGHYEAVKDKIVNGGVDTTPGLAYAYDLALKHHEFGCDVIMEGKNFTESPKWILNLHECKFDIRVALIDIPLEECIKSVRGRGHKIKEETITALHTRSKAQFKIFEKAGVHAIKGSRRQCLEKVQSWLEK
jgi:hypothetical protein